MEGDLELDTQRNSTESNSLITLAFLAFGVLLFQLLSNALYNQESLIGAALRDDSEFKIIGQSKEIELPGYGLFGDFVNSVIETILDVYAAFQLRLVGSECTDRFLCEANQISWYKGPVFYGVSYVFSHLMSMISLIPLSRTLTAINSGTRGENCTLTFNDCH